MMNDNATDSSAPAAPSAPEAVDTSAPLAAPADVQDGPDTANNADGAPRAARNRRRRGGRRAGAAEGAAAPQTDAETRAPRPARAPQAAQGGKPAARGREVHPALQTLFSLYPQMFGARFLPLKLGVFQELLAAHPEAFKKDDLKVALGLHARSTRYLESVAAGLPRHNLQAEPVEPVAPEHVHHAIMEIFRRRQARSREDLRPFLREQLMRAIEASALPLDDYAQVVRTQDETANAVLDEAIAELKLLAAKREALVRMFEASGKALPEFAEMYGMNADDVSDAVARVRGAQPAA